MKESGKSNKKYVRLYTVGARSLILMTFVFWLVSGVIVGKVRIKGEISIPIASGEQHYGAIMHFNSTSIKIYCRENIFRPLNNFDIDCQNWIEIRMNEIRKIRFGADYILIFPDYNFCRKYRHLLVEWMPITMIPTTFEKVMVLIFSEEPKGFEMDYLEAIFERLERR